MLNFSFFLLFLLFLGLKLSDKIDWSWWWISAPIWGFYSLRIIIGLFLNGHEGEAKAFAIWTFGGVLWFFWGCKATAIWLWENHYVIKNITADNKLWMETKILFGVPIYIVMCFLVWVIFIKIPEKYSK